MLRLPMTVSVFLLLLAASLERSVSAGEWPQILGSNRNGIATGERIADSWPAGGPKVVWQRRAGSGFAGSVVAGGKAVLFHRVGNEEIVEAMSAATGKVLWKAAYPATYVPSYSSDNGPRATPLIHNGRVYVYGAIGGLRCIDLKNGKKLWTRDTFEDYSSKRPFRGEPAEGYFGIGSTPIVEGEKLLVNVGGDAAGAGIVAFSLENGKTIWKATSERASYSSPVAATISGARHVIFATRLNVVSIDPANGKVRFRFPFGQPGPKVTGATPLVLGDHLLVSASYNFGAVYAKIGPRGAQTIWSSDEMMSSQYTTCIADGDFLYGVHGRQDIGRAALRCFNPKTRQVSWTEEGFDYATLLKADGKLLILKTDGELVLAEVNSKRYRELARASILRSTTRALPALSNGLLYVRNTETLRCLDLRKSK